MIRNSLTSVELCAGAGGQALGLEAAGFCHEALVEIDSHCCNTLRQNRPEWNVIEQDLSRFDGRPYAGVDLLAGGLPCPPFSKAGKQLGPLDERNLFPTALRLIEEIRPRAIMFENVRGFLDDVFSDFRENLRSHIESHGYVVDWRLLHASEFGVPQLRPRVVIVALLPEDFRYFRWPEGGLVKAPTVGETLFSLMGSRGWPGVQEWKVKANQIAPTVVGGSKKHGGPDLGPTRARKAWRELGVDGLTIGNEPPGPDHEGLPKLTVPMVARLQGFPEDWVFSGRKTPAYRQVGNAFPPPVAKAVAERIALAFKAHRLVQVA